MQSDKLNSTDPDQEARRARFMALERDPEIAPKEKVWPWLAFIGTFLVIGTLLTYLIYFNV